MDDSVRLCLYLVSCNKIMHVLPPPPLCGLYSIRAQNGYRQLVKIILLLTVVVARGVTDL